jgi:hypothetical protein
MLLAAMGEGRHRLTRRQRDAVRETLIWNITSACSDLEMSLAQHEDYREARRLRREIEDNVDLLDDLGWKPQDSRASFELTLSRKRLRRVARRLKKNAAKDLFAHALGFFNEPEASQTYERAVIVGRVCVEISEPPDPQIRCTCRHGDVIWGPASEPPQECSNGHPVICS